MNRQAVYLAARRQAQQRVAPLSDEGGGKVRDDRLDRLVLVSASPEEQAREDEDGPPE
jgi:hypothetical protein